MLKLLIVFIPILLFANNKQEWNLLSNKQKINILKVYKQGAKLNLGYTLAAIAWKESAGGLYQINLSDPSCGTFHTYLPSVMARHNLKDTSFNRNVLCQQLIDNENLSLAEAVAELRYWQVERKNNWFKVWASYNGG